MTDSIDEFDYTDMLEADGFDDTPQGDNVQVVTEQKLPDSEDAQGGQTQNNQDEVVIAVMGTTGSGKSSFIKLLTGDNSVTVGSSLESETSDIQVVRFSDPVSGRTVTIVDTPGFDDSRESITDTEILKRITQFLLDVYDKDRKLNGLIYIQRISDPRFGGQSARNLRMFRNLCGEGGFKNVVVLTTFWDVISNEDGTKRETQLKSKFFKDLIDGGARFMQHDQSLGSAQEVLKHVFTLSPTNVKIQEEIRVEGKSLEDTAAGSVHRKEVEDLIAKHRKEVSELKAEMDEVRNTNATLAQDLKVERDKLERKLKEWESERDDLKKGLDQEKQAVAQLKVDAEVEKKNQEQWRQDKERDWTNRLDSQAKMHGEELGKIQSQLDQEKEASRKREQQSQEMMRRLEERADNDRKALEDRRQEEERQWSMRMQAQADAHEKAVQKMQEQISKAQESPSGNVKQAEERMRRLEEKAEKDKKALEEKRQEDELQWSLRVKSQAEAHEKALLKIQEQQKKASENAKLLEAERRANAAERDKLAAERALQAERNKSWSKKGSEAANAIPVVGILAKPSFILGGAVLDLFDKARKK